MSTLHDINEFIKESNLIEDEPSQIAFQDALAAWERLESFERLNLSALLTTHEILMHSLNPAIAGKLRTVNVRVGARLCPPWDEVPRLLNAWFMNHAGASTEQAIKKAHIAFEKVHPHEDGNGRIGRLIMLWQTVRAGLPIRVIKASERQEYYKWFK